MSGEPVYYRGTEIIGRVPRGITATQEFLSAVADHHAAVRRPLTENEMYALALNATAAETMPRA